MRVYYKRDTFICTMSLMLPHGSLHASSGICRYANKTEGHNMAEDHYNNIYRTLERLKCHDRVCKSCWKKTAIPNQNYSCTECFSSK